MLILGVYVWVYKMSDIGVVQGVVVEIDHKLLTFDIEHPRAETSQTLRETPKTTIYMALLFMENLSQKFPEKGSTVVIKSPFFNCDRSFIRSMIVTSKECEITGNFTLTPITNAFVDVAKGLNLAASHILQLAKSCENLKKSVLGTDINCSDVVLDVLRTLRNVNFELQFLNQMKYIDGDQNSYKEFSYWTFGTHWNWSEIKYLFGFFSVHNNGTIYFTDSRRKIPCVFTNNKSNEILKFLNSYILINEFTYITELYNSLELSTMEYFLINLDKIVKLNIPHCQERLLLCEIPPEIQEYKQMSCRVISKSQLIAVSQKDVFHWLEVILERNTYAFLRLKTVLRNLYPFLRSGQTYTIYYKKPLNKIQDIEIEKLAKEKNPDKSVCCYDVSPGTYFVPTIFTGSDISDVFDAFKKLTSHDVVSFKGIISLKLFNKPIPSATVSATGDPNFGTPGLKTHKLLFEVNDKTLEVYLNNWENLAIPYGLIPDMKVIVHNVKQQKGKYYKSTVLTSIEIVGYEPKLKFETANLYGPEWGVPFCLGAGHSIPSFAILWSRVSVRSILSLKIYTQENDANERELKGRITLIVEDSFGESKIIAKENGAILLLRLLLGLEETTFEKWVNGFAHWGEITYPSGTQDFGISYILNKYFKQLENANYKLKLKCRKMDNEPSGKPLYFLLDGRL